LSVTSSHRAALKQQAQALKPDTILAGLDVLVSARGRFRNTQHSRVLLEMAVVRLARLEDLLSGAQLAQLLQRDGPCPSSPRPAHRARVRLAPPVEVAAEKKKPALNPAPPEPSGPSNAGLNADNLTAIWERVVAQAGPILGSQLKKALTVA